MKPYKQIKLGNLIFRLFYKIETRSLFYKWHIDEKCRTVYFFPLGHWKFQFDNELPFDIKFGTKIKIPKKKFHRLINNSQYLFCIIIEK